MSNRRILITWPGGLPRQSYDLAILEGGAGRVRTYHRNGQLMATGSVVDHLQHGLWKFWNRVGGRSAVGRFENGMPRGEWLYYDHDREFRVVQWQVCCQPDFRISLPQGWHRLAREGHALFSREDPSDEHGPSIAVSCHAIDDALAIRDFHPAAAGRPASTACVHLDFKVQEMESTRIRSLDACEALTTVNHKGQSGADPPGLHQGRHPAVQAAGRDRTRAGRRLLPPCSLNACAVSCCWTRAHAIPAWT
jgi:hypothetical protein